MGIMAVKKTLGLLAFALLLATLLLACKAYPKKETLLLDAQYHFYTIAEEDLRELEKLMLPANARPFPKFSALKWKKYFSVLAYEKATSDLRLISTIFTRQQVRKLLPLFLDAHVLIQEGQRLLVAANDYPYRSINSIPSLTNFMMWYADNEVHIVFGAINEVLFEYARMSDPKFKVDFKQLKFVQEADKKRVVIARQLKPAFRQQMLAGIRHPKWLITRQDWFLQKSVRTAPVPGRKRSGQASQPSDSKAGDPSVIELDL